MAKRKLELYGTSDEPERTTNGSSIIQFEGKLLNLLATWILQVTAADKRQKNSENLQKSRHHHMPSAQ